MRSKIHTTLVILVLLLSLFGWLWTTYDLFKHWKHYQTLKVASTLAIFSVRWTLFLLGAWICSFFLFQMRRKKLSMFQYISSDWLVVRLALYCLLPPFVITSFLHLESLNLLEGNGFLMRSIFYSALFIGLLIWSLWVLHRPRRSSNKLSKNLWWKTIDVVCMNMIIFLFLGETSLIVFNKIRPSMLLYTKSANILTRMESLRWGRGVLYFNFRMNSQGYHDEEFFRAGASDLVIGLLADSFGVGVVPYAYNFATVAERNLQERFGNSYNRIAIHNFGVPAIGMNEYVFLLETEVLQTNPSLVVLCIFVGNDIIESQDFGELKTSRYCFQNWFLWLLPKRLFILSKEKQRQEVRQQRFNVLEIGRLSEDGNIPEYIHNSSKEPSTLSVEKFLEIEQWRFEVCNPNNQQWQKGFEGLFKGLKHFHSRLGSKLFVVLIPDEFQVNDKLYEEIKQSNPHYASYQRNYPQKRILAYCQEHDLMCIDMLPALREGQKKEHTYHLRDTHLNAYGNGILGQELANTIYNYLTKENPTTALAQ